MARSKSKPKVDPAREALEQGWHNTRWHPLFSAIGFYCHVFIREGTRNGPRALVSDNGYIQAFKAPGVTAEEWQWAFTHVLLHLGLGHVKKMPVPRAWEAACDAYVHSFMTDLKIVKDPGYARWDGTRTSETALYEEYSRFGIPEDALLLTVGGPDGDMLCDEPSEGRSPNWTALLAEGLQSAVERAVQEASGVSADKRRINTPAERARSWFMASYPLLGGLAAGMEIIENPETCRRMGIAVAAVSAEDRTLYFNPDASLDDQEMRFVFAHELLHVGLNHHSRLEGRDPYLWNVACDFVINQWLIEMGVGTLPKLGGLYDPELKGLTAEEVYRRIACDLRRYRKLLTFRGIGIGDILAPSGTRGDWAGLDDWYRSALAQGYDLACRVGRGLFPAELIEEIRTLATPLIPWDVQLAQWLDNFFPPLERRRTYARPSRRQASTPDIPRPRWTDPPIPMVQRTFGVVLDTSGSMDAKLLGRGLGAIASYAASREVQAVRVVFCDATAYDAGYMAAEDIAVSVQVKGRGGTILQPGIDMLIHAKDFPKDGPILVITDGMCDIFHVRREHAVMIPQGARLPFWPQCPVFEMRGD